MTSDFDKDEIQDSAFPIDFSQDSASLDMYGVWVKSGPRDVIDAAQEIESSVSEPDTDVLDDLSQFSGLPDFPDFNSLEEDLPVAETELVETDHESESIQVDLPAEPFDFDESDIQFEEISPQSSSLFESSAEDITIIEDDVVKSKEDEIVSIDPARYDEVDFSDFASVEDSIEDAVFEKQVLEENKTDEDFVFDAGADFPEIEFEEIRTEDLDQEDDSPIVDSIEGLDIPISQEIPVLDENISEKIIEEAPLDIVEESDEQVAEQDIEDIDNSVMPDQVETVEDAIDDEARFDAELPSDMDFSNFLDDLNSGNIEAPSGAKPSPSNDLQTDDLDLDSFIDSFNESGGVGADETEKLYTDSEPVEIDLEFDESYIEDANRIKASGSSVSTQEYDSLEFGVEMIDESAGSVGDASSFDSFFDSIPDMGGSVAADSANDAVLSSSLETTTEFDDLLGDLENSAVQAPRSDSSSFSGKTTQSYNLSVTLDEDLNASAPAVADSQSDEDIRVSLVSSAGSGKSDSAAVRADNASSAFAPVQSSDSSDEIDALLAESGLMDTIGSLSDFNATESALDEEPVFSDDQFDSIDADERMENVHDESFENSFSDEIIETERSEELPAPDENQEFIDIPDNSGYNEVISYPQADNSVTLEDSVSVDFDDISAVEQELSEMAPETEEETVIGTDRSTELLMKIADELSSIKNEISTLKIELAGIKGISSDSPEVSYNGNQDKAGDASGFFTDDDPDETIALTGDELNNILITADFTEEKTDESNTSVPEDLQLENIEITDFSDISQVLIDENESVESEQIDIESESIEDEIPETLPDSIFESSDFEIPEQIEVGHVNSLLDDTSYLEGEGSVEPDLDNVAIEEPDLEIIDFDDEKLEEPELTEFNIDLSDIETSFDSELPKEQELSIPEVEDSADITDTESSIIDFSTGNENPAIQESSDDEFSINEDEIHLSESDSFETAAEDSAEMAVSDDIVVQNDFEQDSFAAQEDSLPTEVNSLPVELKEEIKSVLSYMDQLLESLPEEKIEEFARSEHFEVYKKLFEELGIS